MSITNRVRLRGSGFKHSDNVEKILDVVPKRFEATITTLENILDLSKITLEKLLNSLEYQEQRSVMKEDEIREEELAAKHEDSKDK